jgi:Protein of unknown function (DUF3141)
MATTLRKTARKPARQPAPATPPAPAVEVPPAPQAAAERLTLPNLLEDAWRYQVDFWQRSVLFLDILRERANNMLAHEQAGLPPLLNFEYETILDARRFERPATWSCSTSG